MSDEDMQRYAATGMTCAAYAGGFLAATLGYAVLGRNAIVPGLVIGMTVIIILTGREPK